MFSLPSWAKTLSLLRVSTASVRLRHRLCCMLRRVCVIGIEVLRRTQTMAGMCIGLALTLLGGAPSFYIPSTACFSRLAGAPPSDCRRRRRRRCITTTVICICITIGSMMAIRGGIVTPHLIIIRAVPCTAAIMPRTLHPHITLHHDHNPLYRRNHAPRGRPVAGPYSGSIIGMADLPGFSFAGFCFSQYPRILKASGWAGIFRALQVGLTTAQRTHTLTLTHSHSRRRTRAHALCPKRAVQRAAAVGRRSHEVVPLRTMLLGRCARRFRVSRYAACWRWRRPTRPSRVGRSFVSTRRPSRPRLCEQVVDKKAKAV